MSAFSITPDLPALEVKNLGKNYVRPRHIFQVLWPASRLPQKTALQDVSFDLVQGQSLGVVGKNGSGKTTLLKTIATLLYPTKGSVTVFGMDSVRKQSDIRRLISFVPADERSFFWRLSCRENLLFFGVLYGLSPKQVRRKIDELAEELNLKDMLDDRFDTLSSGKKQLVSLARGMLISPRLMIVDEPTRSLDIEITNHVRNFLKRLQLEKNTTLLITSHHLEDIEDLCQQVILLHNGNIAYSLTRKTPDTPISQTIKDYFFKMSDDNSTER